ncbi:MAG: WD40 repeat [Glomeribacter sp. 1016415]|nr:WD40 repeat [Glomeribacter sp. 1016415]
MNISGWGQSFRATLTAPLITPQNHVATAQAHSAIGDRVNAEKFYKAAIQLATAELAKNPGHAREITLANISAEYAAFLAKVNASDAFSIHQPSVPINHPTAEAHQPNFSPTSLLSSIQAAHSEGEIVVQNCHGKINAPVYGNNNIVNVHDYSASPELLPQIKAMHTSVGELKTAYLDRFKEQQALELRSKKEPLAILGQNIEAEYFTAWKEPGEIQDGLAMYVAPQATTLTDKKTFFDLDEAVAAFLTQASASSQKNQVLLLRGEAGSGKSTFNRHLARRLWQDYSAASGERPIPLYISLPTVDRPNKNLIGQYLSEKCGFSPEQIDALRASQRFILILDGYDEIPAEQRNLYADEKLDQWRAKILLSCRPEYLTDGYKNHLQPRGRSRVLLEYQLAPFSEQSIETYIHQYVEYTQAQWSAQGYQDRLAQIPNVKELLGTPFLLKMALSVLPTLEKSRFSHLALKRIKLYEQFVQTWFERSLERLDAIQSKLTKEEKKAFRSLKDEGFIEHSQTFNIQFALAMSSAKTTVAEYSPIARLNMPQGKRYETFLSNKDEEKNLLRFSALLTRQQQQYRFIHKSIQDYLVARAVWEELENSNGLDVSAGFEPLNGIKAMHLLWEELDASTQVYSSALLNQFNLLEEVAIQGFLVERVQQNRALLKPLLTWIKTSTTEESASTAAANAITILVKAGVPFTRTDLKGIRIPGADLRQGMFDSAQLQGSDLSQVNFSQSWLREANLSSAQMAGVRFGEWPTLQEENIVLSCAYSPDGKTCAIGLYNDKISVYLTSDWTKICTLKGHTSAVFSVVYSPSGDQIASSGGDNTVRLWDAYTGALNLTLQGHTAPVMSVVYSPSGERLASGSWDHTVRLWDVQSGLPGLTLQGHIHAVFSVVYSPSGDQIASSSLDNTVRMWDAHSGTLGLILEGHTGGVASVVYSPSGDQIASGGGDNTVRLWDVQSGVPSLTLRGHTNNVLSIVYSPCGKQIASGSVDHTVRLWDVQSGAPGPILQGHTGNVWSVVYSPNGDQITSGSVDTTVRVWSTQSSDSTHILQGHTEAVESVVYSPNGDQIASGSRDHTVRLWDAQIGAPGLILQGHADIVGSVAYSPSGDQIASGSDDNTVRLWDVHSGAHSRTLQGHIDEVWRVIYSPSGDQIASGSKDSTVRLWDAHSGVPGLILHGHTAGVWSVMYSPSGDQLASGSYDNTVRLWEVQSGTLDLTLQGHTDKVSSVVYSPCGEQIASGSLDNTVRLWDAHSGASGLTLRGHTDGVFGIVYSPCGEQLASGSFDNTVRLWATQTGQCQIIILDCGPVASLAWKEISDVHYLGIGSMDHSVRQWEVKKEGKGYRAEFCWSSTHRFLTVRGASIEGVHGLSGANQKFLKQRGAVGEPF